MNWSYLDLQQTPESVIAEVLAVMAEEAQGRTDGSGDDLR